MRDAGHRTPDAGHRTAKKAKIIYPPPRGVDIKIAAAYTPSLEKQCGAPRDTEEVKKCN